MENSRLARSGRGFTLIELLVVITIIGILVGILMPAVQSAREAGRRTDCMNNLKQMSTASQNHLASLGYLPGGGNCSDTPTFDTSGNPCVGRKQDSSWIYQILPYLGQTPLWQKIPTPGNPSQDNCALRAATPLSFIFCPSRTRVRIVMSLKASPPAPRCMCDYAGNGGTYQNLCPFGPFFWNCGEDGPMTINGTEYHCNATLYPEITLGAITKGTTQTVFLGEKCVNAEHIYMDEADDDDGWLAGWDADTNRWGCIPALSRLPQSEGGSNRRASDCIYTYSTQLAFGSAHLTSCNFAMCDGSVRSTSYSIDPLVFEYFCSRNPAMANQTGGLQSLLNTGKVTLQAVGAAGF